MKRPWTGLTIVGAMAAFTAAVYGRLPPRIATHWNLAGEPDGWSGRPGAWLLPTVALGTWALLMAVPRIDPRGDNYARFRDTYLLVVNLTLVFLGVLHVATVGSALGWPVEVGRLTNAMLGLLFVGLGNVLPRVRPNWFLGIRTPWTLESDRVWRETHRLGGRVFVAGGVLILLLALLPDTTAEWLLLPVLLGTTAVPVVYSYLAWRRERAG
ncbi:MAG: SdpI family protein [Gemmatimonadota bacterium]|nr:SdpI family protein [Gemmatimonadota bacterium]